MNNEAFIDITQINKLNINALESFFKDKKFKEALLDGKIDIKELMLEVKKHSSPNVFDKLLPVALESAVKWSLDAIVDDLIALGATPNSILFYQAASCSKPT